MALVCIGLSICSPLNSLMWIYLAYSDSPKTSRDLNNFLSFSQLWPCLLFLSLKGPPRVICMQRYKNSPKPLSLASREREVML